MRTRQLIRSYGWVKLKIPEDKMTEKIREMRLSDNGSFRHNYSRLPPHTWKWNDDAISFNDVLVYLKYWLGEAGITDEYKIDPVNKSVIFSKKDTATYFALVWS